MKTILETDRLLLREFVMDDAEAFFRINNPLRDPSHRRATIMNGTRYRLKASAQRQLELPDALQTVMERTFQQLLTASTEFGLLMRELVPEFHVYLVRLCDGGHPAPLVRARRSVRNMSRRQTC